MIIGFGHRRRVGKDTAAGILWEHYFSQGRSGVRVTSFAATLKAEAHRLWGWAGVKPADFYDQYQEYKEEPLPELGKSPRDLYIELGNKVREIYPLTWVKCSFDGYTPNQTWIVSDVRYQNEVDMIKSLGGVVVKIVRPSVPHFDDVADSSLDGYKKWDAEILNMGNMKEFEQKVIATAEGLNV